MDWRDQYREVAAQWKTCEAKCPAAPNIVHRELGHVKISAAALLAFCERKAK